MTTGPRAPGEFFPVPSWVVGRSDVSMGAIVLLGCLYAYERRRKQEWPNVAQLCEDMRHPRRTITRWLEELTGVGLVTSVKVGREVQYAPATDAKTGARRDLDRHPAEGTEHAPEVARVESGEHGSSVAHVPAEHGSSVAHVADSHLSLIGERSEGEGESARATPAGIVEASYASALGVVGGRYIANPTRDLPHWRSAVDGVKVMGRPDETFRAAAERLALSYVNERRSRSPEWFAEWLQRLAAVGGEAARGGYARPSTNHEATSMDEIAAYEAGVSHG